MSIIPAEPSEVVISSTFGEKYPLKGPKCHTVIVKDWYNLVMYKNKNF
jgi:hypothetical protein